MTSQHGDKNHEALQVYSEGCELPKGASCSFLWISGPSKSLQRYKATSQLGEQIPNTGE